MIVSATDIALCKQPTQRHYVMLQVLSKEMARLFNIEGYLTSYNNNIDDSSDVRRTASLTMRFDNLNISDILSLNLNNYIRLYRGIKNELTGNVTWWKQGVYIINDNSINFNLTDKSLSISLTDKMYDLSGDRKGDLGVFDPIAKYEEKIVDVMTDVLEQNCGVMEHNITPICAQHEDGYDISSEDREKDYLIPYDMKFNTGVTALEVMQKLRDIYPYYEIFFDIDGTFVCQKMVTENDNSNPLLNDNNLRGLVISEDRNVNTQNLANVICVYGKDGLYYGESRDITDGSPFTVSAVGEIVKTFSGGVYDNIYTTYYDDEMTKVQTDGNDMAQDWADMLLYQHCRYNDTLTLNLTACPFINDVDFKITYKSKLDNIMRGYKVTKVSHTLSNTTLECIRFYEDNCVAYQPQLATPVIVSHTENGMTISVTVNAVDFATKYELYANNVMASNSTTTTISYTFPSEYSGTYTMYVCASADGYNRSLASTTFTVEISDGNVLITNSGDYIITNSGDNIAVETE